MLVVDSMCVLAKGSICALVEGSMCVLIVWSLKWSAVGRPSFCKWIPREWLGPEVLHCPCPLLSVIWSLWLALGPLCWAWVLAHAKCCSAFLYW